MTQLDEATAFAKALAFTLRYEGGFCDDPDDPGGRTNYGITQRVYNAYRVSNHWPIKDVLNITSGEVSDIYKTRYWKPATAGRNWPLSPICFDIAVNQGLGALEIMMNDIRPKVSPSDPERQRKLAELLIPRRNQYYQAIVDHWRAIGKPRPDKYLAGWLARSKATYQFLA